MSGKHMIRAAFVFATALALCGCDPNPNGPSAPSAPAASEPASNVLAKKKSVSTLQKVGPPAGPAR